MRHHAIAILALSTAALTPPAIAQSDGAGQLSAEIRTTAHGVPHIKADTIAGAGFGYGYVFAEQNICDVASRFISTRGERSAYYGPDGETDPNPGAISNLKQDFYWKMLSASGIVNKELAEPGIVTAEVRDLIRGYVAGYNKYLADTGVDNLPDPRCRGQKWVVPITEMDVYNRAMHWNGFFTFAGARPGGLIEQIVSAAPPKAETAALNPVLPHRVAALGPLDFRPEVIVGPGSNMMALGKDATANGSGMVFANPHHIWRGPQRWYEAQMTVPGKLDVYGAGIFGLPVVIFGNTAGVAWSHTLSTTRHHTFYELKLAPNDPTAYLFDGKVEKMQSMTVVVDVKRSDGSVSKESHTFWHTRFGPVLQSPQMPWTQTTAYAIRSTPMTIRWLSQQLAMNMAQSVDELDAAGRKYMAIGFLNTMAADSKGYALFVDHSPVPNVTAAMLKDCVTSELGKRTLDTRIPVLDGWRSACEWRTDKDAPLPGLYGPAALPRLKTTQYVASANESPWGNSARQPITGYPLLVGLQETPLHLRSRLGLKKIEDRLNGRDGLPGNRFTLDQLEDVTMNNRVMAGILWRDDLVGLCRTLPATPGFPEACDVLARWDLTQSVDSRGALLFLRFFENLIPFPDERLMTTNVPPPFEAELFTVPFNPKDMVNTPRGLDTKKPNVTKALLQAVADLRDSGIALDARYGDYHYDDRYGMRIGLPGGPPGPGQYNYMQGMPWVPGVGYTDFVGGSTYLQWTTFTDKGVSARSLMAMSQSGNPTSPYAADQTVLFSKGRSKQVLFTEAEIHADPTLKITRICEGATRC